MKVGVTILARHRDRDRYVFIGKKAGYDGLYLCPGGGVEQYETLADAAVREFREETGLRLDEGHFFTIYEHIDAEEHAHKILVVFLGNCSGTPRAGSDAGEVLLFTPQEIRAYRRLDKFSEITAALLEQVGELR